jgi:hypothetical protein
MQVPDYTESLIGFREWLVEEVEGRALLKSSYVGRHASKTYWYPGEEKLAYCPHLGGISRDCTCGLYAYYQLPYHARKTWKWELNGYPKRVRGIVEASGRIILHSSGFRAERMKIVAFFNRGPGHEALAEEYGVAAVYPENVDEFLEGRFVMSPQKQEV